MYKPNNVSQSLIAILITIGLVAAASGQVQKCAAVSEYCQNHWECCSNSCMSYLYKCVRNYNIYPYTFLSYEPPQTTLEDILAMNFGVNSYVRPNAKPQPIGVYESLLSANEVVPNSQVVELVNLQPPTMKSFTAEGVATQATATPVFQTVSRLGAGDEILSITTTTEASPSAAQSPTLTTTTPPPPPPAAAATASTITTPPAAAATASTITSSNSTRTTPPAKCSAIGVKCYRNEECCSERCHGFLHQCVT